MEEKRLAKLSRFIPHTIVIFIGFGTVVGIWFALEKWVGTADMGPRSQLGAISDLRGDVKIRWPKTVSTEDAKAGLMLEAGTKIETRSQSSITIRLFDGAEISLGENGHLVLDRTSGEGPVRVLWIAGELSVHPSAAGERALEVYRDGSKISFEQLRWARTRPVLDLGAGTTVGKNGAGDSSAVLPLDSGSPPAKPTPYTSTSRKSSKRSPLSDAEIKAVLGNQASQVQRCYISYVTRTKARPNGKRFPKKGKILLSLEITPTGRIHQARVAKSDFSESVFLECVTGLFSRVRFRAFEGENMTVQYPVQLK